MIRPVPYVNLPGIVRAVDERARMKQGEVANFVVAPDIEEPRSGLAVLVSAILPITPASSTWIAEEHWRLLGLAQTRHRPGAQAWDLAYLAAMTPGSAPGEHPHALPEQDVLLELIEYVLNAAINHGVQRMFVRVEDERPELELFVKLSFQRYARELTYWLDSAQDGVERLEQRTRISLAQQQAGESIDLNLLARLARLRRAARGEQPGASGSEIVPDVPLRRWHRHDAWGLMRLYDACTPRRVQLAEGLTSDELVHTRAAGGRTWTIPMLEPSTIAVVHDRGVRLGGWLRLRLGRGAQPHVLSLMAHPDDPEVAPALLRFGLSVLAREAPHPIICQVRDYDVSVVEALRTAGFEHTGSHALLIRHLTARALRGREAPAVEPRVVYGVKGLGTIPTRLSKGEKTYYAREHARRS